MRRIWIVRAAALLLCTALLGWLGGDQNDSYFHTGTTWTITGAEATIPRLSQREWDQLRGLRVLFLGDSQFCGYTPEEHDDLWITRLGTQYGLLVENCSTTGSTLTDGLFWGYVFQGRYDPICRRELPPGEFDAILVCGGYNDWRINEPLGLPDSRDACTFAGALNTLFDRLKQEQPQAKLGYVTGFISNGARNATARTTQDYFAVAVEVCRERGIPCLEAWDPDVSGIYATSREFRTRFFLTPGDGWHLNPEGHRLYMPVVGQFLLDITREDP